MHNFIIVRKRALCVNLGRDVYILCTDVTLLLMKNRLENVESQLSGEFSYL